MRAPSPPSPAQSGDKARRGRVNHRDRDVPFRGGRRGAGRSRRQLEVGVTYPAYPRGRAPPPALPWPSRPPRPLRPAAAQPGLAWPGMACSGPGWLLPASGTAWGGLGRAGAVGCSIMVTSSRQTGGAARRGGVNLARCFQVPGSGPYRILLPGLRARLPRPGADQGLTRPTGPPPLALLLLTPLGAWPAAAHQRVPLQNCTPARRALSI